MSVNENPSTKPIFESPRATSPEGSIPNSSSVRSKRKNMTQSNPRGVVQAPPVTSNLSQHAENGTEEAVS